MVRTHEDRTAPGPPPGAVPSTPDSALLRERDFWRAVVLTLLATLTPWPR
jgi:hypothetical protein